MYKIQLKSHANGFVVIFAYLSCAQNEFQNGVKRQMNLDANNSVKYFGNFYFSLKVYTVYYMSSSISILLMRKKIVKEWCKCKNWIRMVKRYLLTRGEPLVHLKSFYCLFGIANKPTCIITERVKPKWMDLSKSRNEKRKRMFFFPSFNDFYSFHEKKKTCILIT